MKDGAIAHQHTHGWLDHLAISMAFICAVHCLLTPVLIVLLPVIATSFFVHQDFHIWMLLLVLPTTGLSLFIGCRKHKDKWSALFCGIGLLLLIVALTYERIANGGAGAALASSGHEGCVNCVHNVAANTGNIWAWINTFGGVFLAMGHFRNFRLCRKTACQHD